MKIYLVGGAVRDSLMGLKPKDLDYVVVDSSIKEMLSLGYEKVGIDFPVFLHPKTKDEYALARIERSIGNRYEDFITETNNVSLNEDLIRRDLTINAIAFKDGLYYDPFNGMNDLKNKILRHTSNAFKEDPVRILRIARFLARYPDFNVAKETKKLIIEMINNNMINSLVPKRIWKELSRALTEKKPSKFFKFLKTNFSCSSIVFLIIFLLTPLNKLINFLVHLISEGSHSNFLIAWLLIKLFN